MIKFGAIVITVLEGVHCASTCIPASSGIFRERYTIAVMLQLKDAPSEAFADSKVMSEVSSPDDVLSVCDVTWTRSECAVIETLFTTTMLSKGKGAGAGEY